MSETSVSCSKESSFFSTKLQAGNNQPTCKYVALVIVKNALVLTHKSCYVLWSLGVGQALKAQWIFFVAYSLCNLMIYSVCWWHPYWPVCGSAVWHIASLMVFDQLEARCPLWSQNETTLYSFPNSEASWDSLQTTLSWDIVEFSVGGFLLKCGNVELFRYHSLWTNQFKSAANQESPVEKVLHHIPAWLIASYLLLCRCSGNNCRMNSFHLKQRGEIQSQWQCPFKGRICIVKIVYCHLPALAGFCFVLPTSTVYIEYLLNRRETKETAGWAPCILDILLVWGLETTEE